MRSIHTFMKGTAIAITFLTSVNVFAQTDSISDTKRLPEQIALDKAVSNTKVIGIDTKGMTLTPQQDSVRQLITRFYVDQFRHFQDPRAPYFMFMSKNANLAMGIGGVVRMRGWFDWNGSIPANGFCPYLIQIPKDPTNKKNLSATPAGTAIFFTVMGRNSPIGDYMGYIEANFNGYQGVGFKLKKAYVTVNDWTVGYASTSFSDPAAEVPVIDGAGPNGKLSKSAVLVRYMHNFKGNKWLVGGSLEFPDSQQATDGTTTKKCTDYVPVMIGFGQYQWNEGISHIRAAAMLKVMSYRDLITQQNHSVCGWGAQLSATFKVIPNLNVYAIGNVGQGHASYMGDLSIGNYDLVPDIDKPGKMYAPTALGLSFGLKYNFLYNLYADIAFGELRYFPKKNPNSSEYKYGLYGAVNLFWDITPRFQVGAEYLVGKRKNFDHTHGNANRVDALFQMSF